MKKKTDFVTFLIKYRLTTIAAINIISVEIARINFLFKAVPGNLDFGFFGNLAIGCLLVFLLFLFERKMNAILSL